MKITNTLLKAVSIILCAAFLFAALIGCTDETTETPATPEGLMDISGFTIVRPDNTTDHIIDYTASLKKAIKENVGAELTVSLDDTAESEKEILIGETNRAASASALEKLAEATSEDSYIIDITENKICIVGTTDNATLRAIKIFTEEYVNVSAGKGALDISAGATKAKTYNSANIEVLDNGLEIEICHDAVTIVEECSEWYLGGIKMEVSNLGYPKGVTLQHQKNPEDNGKIISHLFVSDKLGPKTKSCVVESSDGGKTWKIISRPTEQNAINKAHGLEPGNMSQIYELPEQVGDYPAGTLVYANGSLSYGLRAEIWMWYSTDCGRTWKQTAQIATMLNNDSEGKGVWEPHAIYDDGYLYCFYSDQTNPTYDQALSFRRSKDGVNWEEPKYVCAFEGEREGPGMIIITKMGNGEFFAVYEYYGKAGNHAKGQVYYKKTTDLNDWGDPSDLGTMIKSGKLEIMGAPACVWVPAGGECGTLIVSGKEDNSKTEEHRIMVSNDYGKTWVTMANPLPYNRGDADKSGKSPTFFAALDGRTIYYINQTANIGVNRKLEFISFKIY